MFDTYCVGCSKGTVARQRVQDRSGYDKDDFEAGEIGFDAMDAHTKEKIRNQSVNIKNFFRSMVQLTF